MFAIVWNHLDFKCTILTCYNENPFCVHAVSFGTHLLIQDSVYPSMNTSYYKFGPSEPGSYSYYDHGHAYEVNGHGQGYYYENRRPLASSPMTIHQQTAAACSEWGGTTSATSHDNSIECKLQMSWLQHARVDVHRYLFLMFSNQRSHCFRSIMAKVAQLWLNRKMSLIQ